MIVYDYLYQLTTVYCQWFFFYNNELMMEVQKTKKWRYLFEVELQQDELEALIHLDESLLKNLIYRCSRIFQKQKEDRQSLSVFLNNYRMIMELHSAVVVNSFSVNMCLHFALLYSQFLLLYHAFYFRQNREQEAKAILKQTDGYIEIQGTDPMLISVCLNNLAYLYSRQGKIYKSLAVALKAVSIIEDHLQELVSRKDKERLIEDVIVFVNVLIVTQNVLLKILKTNSKTFFKSLLKIVNRLGYSFSQKYLGSQSIFTRKFYFSEDSILLPVYHEEESQVQQVNQFQVRIANELEGIYEALKDLNLQPEVFYINEHSAKSKLKSDTSSIQIQQEITPEPEFSVCFSESFLLESWQAQVSIFRESTDLIIASPSFEFLGHVQFKLGKDQQVIVYKIPEENFIKIVNCLNFYDVLPYQYEFRSLNPTDFFRKVLLNFVSISREGELKITPRALSVLDPFQKTFFNKSVYILVNHLYFRKFRLSICPLLTSEAIYLDIEFKDKQIYHFYKLTEIMIPAIWRLANKYNTPEQITNYEVKFNLFKKIVLKDKQGLKARISKIVSLFQQFLFDNDIENIEQLINNPTNLDHGSRYFLYLQEKEDKGQFFQFRYRANAQYIDVYNQNTFKTYTPSGLSKAKGSTIITPAQFFKDFGVHHKNVKKWLSAFYPLIAQKYTLKAFEERIDDMDEDRFQQNAMIESNFVSKFFKRMFIPFEDYMLPVTLQVLSIAKEKPIGIRASVYEPIKGVSLGLFIYVNSDYWQNPPEAQSQNQQLDSSFIRNSYKFTKGYFLTKWLTEEGFSLIFSKLTIVNRTLAIRGHSGKFLRLEQFF